MFVMFKQDDGSFALRPAFIGFIKNNFIRRSLMILIYPITVALTISINYLILLMIIIAKIIRLTWHNLKMLKKMPWHDEIWNNHRTK